MNHDEGGNMPKIVPTDVIRAQAHVIGLLNEVESVLTGWVLGYDREKVAELTHPLYELCDTDDVPALAKKEATS